MKIKSRLYLAQPFDIHQEVTLDTQQAHFVRNVLRVKTGDHLEVFHDHGGYLATISHCDKKKLRIMIGELIRPHLAPENITLLFALIKKTPLDYLLQKATEIGCGHFQPILTDYTVIKDFNVDRAQKITIEAAEQCGLTALPKISPPVKLEVAIKNYDNILYGAERQRQQISAQENLFKISNINAILIGPEGGFSDPEHNMLSEKKGSIPVSLGKRILRAETAAIVALSQTIL